MQTANGIGFGTGRHILTLEVICLNDLENMRNEMDSVGGKVALITCIKFADFIVH